MENKMFAVFSLLIMLFSAVPAITAQTTIEINDPALWAPSVRDLAGSSSAGGWTHNSTAEYYELPVNITTNGTCWIAEFQVPNGYMGLDVWAWDGTNWILKNGASGYSLSVPYLWNFTDKITGSSYTTSIPADWGSGGFLVSTPSSGSLYRVQLRVDEDAQLKIKIRYGYGAGLDGVDDRILFLDSNPQTSETVNIVFKVYDINKESAFFSKNDFVEGTYYFYTNNNAYSWARYYDGNFYNNWDGSSLPAYQVINATVELKPSFPLQISINGTTTNGNMLPSELVTNNAEFVVGSLWHGALPSIINFISVKKSNLETNVLFFNGTHFVDLSGNGNHGTPFGNVQYKVYTGTGFKVSFPACYLSVSWATYPENTGTIVPASGNHTVAMNSLITLLAYPYANYRLKYFLINGTEKVSNATTISVIGDTDIKIYMESADAVAMESFFLFLVLAGILAIQLVFYRMHIPLLTILTGLFGILAASGVMATGESMLTPLPEALFMSLYTIIAFLDSMARRHV